MWIESMNIAQEIHRPREVWTQANESNWFLLISYIMPSTLHPYCTHMSWVVLLLSSCRWVNWGWEKLSKLSKVRELIRGQCLHVIPGLYDSWTRKFHLYVWLQFKEKVKEKLKVAKVWSRDIKSYFYSYLSDYLRFWFVIIFCRIFLLKCGDFVTFNFVCT